MCSSLWFVMFSHCPLVWLVGSSCQISSWSYWSTFIYLHVSIAHARQEFYFTLPDAGAQKVPCSLSRHDSMQQQRRRHTMTQHKVWKSYIGLWVTLTNCASEWMESLTSPQGCGPPACLHSFGLLEHWLESRRPSAIIIFPHRNSGRHHYHGTTVCGLMASHFHSPCHVVAIEGGCSYSTSLAIYSALCSFFDGIMECLLAIKEFCSPALLQWKSNMWLHM